MPIRAEPKDLATEKVVNQELRWKPLKYLSKSYGRPDDKKLSHHCHDGDGNDHEEPFRLVLIPASVLSSA